MSRGGGLRASCIIPSFRAFSKKGDCLRNTLESLGRLRLTAELEIIVVSVDSDETPATLLSLVPSDAPLNVRLINYPYPYDRSGARNFGAREASHEVLWFLDDDTLVMSGDVRSVISSVTLRMFACGARRYWTPIGWTRDWLSRQRRDDGSYAHEGLILPSGINRDTGYRDLQEFSFIGNCGFILRDAFLEAGGFDQESFRSRREDVELMFRLTQLGFTYRHLFDDLAVLHLNHAADVRSSSERVLYHRRFRAHERAAGYRFKVNHLFGVYENDGDDVLEPILDEEA